MSAATRPSALRRSHLSTGTSALALGGAMLLLATSAAAQTAPQTQSQAQDEAQGTPTQAQVTTPGPSANTGAAPQSTADAAQAGVSDTATPAADDSTGDIVVTGFRAALRTATAKKKNSESLIESVSAEDIGKLPDNGIGESIARLPGVAAQRNGGRANIISIRGLGPDFSTTTLNGRQQTTTNDSRAVEFDQYPSEILAGVDIYKTSQADHPAGGLVGSIDLRTIRPLDVSQRILTVGARGTIIDQKIDPNSTNKGFRAYGTFVDRFLDDRLGVAISAAYTDEPYQTRDFNAWGFGGYPGGGQGMNGIKTWSETDKLKRFGGNATVQAKMSDEVTFTVDAFYSHFIDRIDQRGFEMPMNCGGGCGGDSISAVTRNANGLVTAATVAGTPVIENYANDRTADQYAVAWNGVWKNDAGWRVMGDFSWSRTDRTDDSLQTTAGLRRGGGLPPTAVIGYTLTPNGPQFTSNYNGASSALVLTDVEGWSGSPIQAGYDNLRKTKDDLVEARAEIEREIGGLIKSVKVGADYVTRSKTLNANEAYLSPPNGAAVAAIPASLLLTPVPLDRGLGNLVAYDPRKLVGAGVLTYIPNTFGSTKGYQIQEDVWTPYAMASLGGQFGTSELTGNIGVQGVHTDVTSSGQLFPTVEDKYWYVLPSANLNFRTENGFVVRIAASKQMMRPRLPDLNNVITFGVDTTRNPIVYSGSGGNPTLRPYRATAVDLSFEKYFSTKGYLAVQLFWKHIDTYIANGYTLNFDYSSFPKPAGIQPATPIGILFANVNTSGGKLYGAEVAGTLPFEVITPALAGFGITGGAGYTYSRVFDFNGAVTDIPGYSKWVGNATVFYEKSGFSVRGSMRYRSSYLGDFALYSGGLDRQQVLGETIYDAQVGYDFAGTSALHGLSVYLQGQNLTNERSATLAKNGTAILDPLAYLKYQSYGRRYVAGFTYKF